MIKINLGIRELFVVFSIFLVYCIFVFYITGNIIEKFENTNCNKLERYECGSIGEDICEWNSNYQRCLSKSGVVSSKEVIKNEDELQKVRKIFCDRLKKLHKPSDFFTLKFKGKFDAIEQKEKYKVDLEKEINKQLTKYYRLKTKNILINTLRQNIHASKQIDVINKGIDNINNKDKININLE